MKKKNNQNNPLVPAKSYPNSDISKAQILSENSKLSGIYMWINLVNGKKYIGSAVNIANRMKNYFTKSYLLKNNMNISKALLKYKY